MPARDVKSITLASTAICLAIVGIWYWSGQNASSPASSNGAGAIAQGQNTGITNNRAGMTAPDSSEWARRLAARQGASDLESLTANFNEAADCVIYHGAIRELASISNDDRLDDLSRDTPETLKHIGTRINESESIVRQAETLCKGSNRTTVARTYSNALFNAALAGIPDAESCFVIESPVPAEDRVPEERVLFFQQRYVKYAPGFMHNALERGDPYVARVALYGYVASPPEHPSSLDDMPKADPYLTWRTARLASLRATPESRENLEYGLKLLAEQNILHPDEIARADAWARMTYEQDFAGQPPIDVYYKAPCYTKRDFPH